jgi:hypothetical protein
MNGFLIFGTGMREGIEEVESLPPQGFFIHKGVGGYEDG